VALSLGFGSLSLADLRGGDSSWTPPTLMPTPEPVLTDGAAPGDAAGRFVAGMQARNITGTRVNVRRTPGHLGKPDDDVLLQVQPGEVLTILGDVASANGLTWHRVAVNGSEGWVAESTASGVQILEPAGGAAQ
jgi:hypothetical protein